MNNEEVKKLYNALGKKGYTGLGSETQFTEWMSDSTNRKKLYDAVSANNNFRIGDYNTYESRLTGISPELQQNDVAVAESTRVAPVPFMEESAKVDLSEPITSLGESVRQSGKMYMADMKAALAENRMSKDDYAIARDRLQEMRDRGEDISAFDVDKAINEERKAEYLTNLAEWEKQMEGRRAERENLGVGKAFLHRMKDPQRPRDPFDQTNQTAELFDYEARDKQRDRLAKYNAIQDALKQANGDVDKAMEILDAQSKVDTRADELKKKSLEAHQYARPTEGFGAWVGGILPQMAGNAAAILASANPWTRWMARPLGYASAAASTLSAGGAAMADARAYAEENGIDISDADLHKVRDLSMGWESITEAIPFERYFGKFNSVVKSSLGESVTDAIKRNVKAQDELTALIQRANKELGGKFFTWDTAKEITKDALLEGLSEFLAEGGGSLVPMVYANEDDYPTLKEILANGIEGFKGGLFMGGFLGSANHAVMNSAIRNERKKRGHVDLAETKDGGIVEILGVTPEGYTVLLPDGSVQTKKEDDLGEKVSIPFNEFDKQALSAETVSAYEKGKQLDYTQYYNANISADDSFNALSEKYPELANDAQRWADLSPAQVQAYMNDLTDDERDMVGTFLAAEMKRRGAIDGAKERADADIQATTQVLEDNKDVNGNITSAVYKEQPVYVRDVQGENAVIIKDGKREMVNKKDLENMQTRSFDDVVTEYADQVNTKVAQETDFALHNHPNTKVLGVGEQMTDMDGKTYQIVSVSNAADPISSLYGVVECVYDAENNKMKPKNSSSVMQITYNDMLSIQNDFNRAKDEAIKMSANEAQNEGTSSEEIKQSVSEEVTESQNEPTETESVAPISPAAPQTARERVPKDEKGNPIYEQTDADTAWDAIVEETEGDVEMAQRVAADMLEDKKAALAKLQNGKPKKGATVAEKIANEKAHAAAIAQAKNDIAQWEAIVGTENRRREAAMSEAERYAAEMEQKNISEGLKALGEPQSLEEYVLAHLAGGSYKLRWSDKENGTKGFGSHTGLSTEEMKARLSMIDNKNGLTPEEIAHSIVENMDMSFGEVDVMDVTDMVIDAVSTHASRRSMLNGLIEARAEIMRQQERADQEAKDAWYMEQYHATEEELAAYNEYLETFAEEIYGEDVDYEQRIATFAEIQLGEYDNQGTDAGLRPSADQGEGLASDREGGRSVGETEQLDRRELREDAAGVAEAEDGRAGGSVSAQSDVDSQEGKRKVTANVFEMAEEAQRNRKSKKKKDDTARRSIQESPAEADRVSGEIFGGESLGEGEFVSARGDGGILEEGAGKKKGTAKARRQSDNRQEARDGKAERLSRGISAVQQQAIDEYTRTNPWDANLTDDERGMLNMYRMATINELDALAHKLADKINSGKATPRDRMRYDVLAAYAKSGELKAVADAMGVEYDSPVSLDTIKDLFEKFNSDPELAVLFNRVFPLVKEINPTIVYRRFTEKDLDEGEDVSPDDILGQYSLQDNLIEYNRNQIDSNHCTEQEKASTIVHEMIHAVARYAIRVQEAHNNGVELDIQLPKRLLDAAQSLIEVYDAIKDNEIFNDDRYESGKMYGVSSVHEMLSELADPEFREKLKQVSIENLPSDKRGLVRDALRAIKDFIHRMFGWDSSSAYARTKRALDKLIDNYDSAGYNKARVFSDDDFAQQRTYHGSGALFDKFDHSFMGEGSGLQAYGWGTYVSENEEVGRVYARGEEGERFLYTVDIPDEKRGNYIVYSNTVTDRAADKVFDGIYERVIAEEADMYDTPQAKADLKQELDDLRSAYGQGQSGTWRDLYGDIASYLGSEKAASMFLNESGYVGAKYADAGNTNYVIFNEKDLKILRAERFREGEGEISDKEVSYQNDPIAKWMGKPRYTGKKAAAFAERERKRMKQAVNEVAEALKIKVHVLDSTESLHGKKAKAKGWYQNGEIAVVIPNHVSAWDAVQTVLHEGIAHYGLRNLFGEKLDVVLDNIYNNVAPELKSKIDAIATERGLSARVATEEYLASLAEDTNFEEAKRQGWWAKIKNWFAMMFSELTEKDASFFGQITDNELRYILWSSYQKLTRRVETPMSMIEDMKTQQDLKVGNYAERKQTAPMAAEMSEAEEWAEVTMQRIEELEAQAAQLENEIAEMEADRDADDASRYEMWEQQLEPLRKQMEDVYAELEGLYSLEAESAEVYSEDAVRYRLVDDSEVIAKLEASPKRTGYRNVVLNENGTFSSPMAYWLQHTKGGAKTRIETDKFELGQWEEAQESLDLVDEDGYIALVKPDKSTVKVAYDPYIHNRLEPVNLQFKDAWKRDDLVYVETEVAETDLNSGYHAEKAKLPVGVHSWSNGDVMLSKYDKPVRIMPWDEVADAWAERLNGEGVNFDRVPAAMRELIVERGVEILPPTKGMGKDCNDAYKKWREENPKKNRQGNLVDENGKLIVDKVNSISDMTDEDFTNPTRSIQLPKLPKIIDEAIGAEGKPVVIKKNILIRNANEHPEVSPQQSREIIQEALYNANLYGKNKPKSQPHRWVLIKTLIGEKKNGTILLEMLANNENVEVIHWHYVDNRGLEKIKRQAEREGGQILILPSSSEEAGALSSRANYLSSDSKGTNINHNSQEENVKSRNAEEIIAEVERESANLGVQVRIARSIDELPDEDTRKRAVDGKLKGYFDPRTGEVVLYEPNTDDANDAKRTILHEIVGHKGLRNLIGEADFNKMMIEMYYMLPERVRQSMNPRMQRNGWSIPVAMEEYLSEKAEEGGNLTLWQRMKSALYRWLRKHGVNVNLSEADVKYLLWRSRKKLEADSPFDMARDITLKRDAVSSDPDGDIRYREGKKAISNMANAEYEKAVMSTGAAGPIRGLMYAFGNIGNGGFKAWKNDMAEAFVDYSRSLAEAQKAIEKALGRKIRGYEDAHSALNALSSKIQRELFQLQDNILHPLSDAIAKLNAKANKTFEEFERYLESKHGLERNLKYAERDAEAESEKERQQAVASAANDAEEDRKSTHSAVGGHMAAYNAKLQAEEYTQEQYEEKVAKLNEWRDKRLAKIEDKLQKRLAQAEANKVTKKKELFDKYRKEDYSGLTEMYTNEGEKKLPLAELEKRAKAYVDEFEGACDKQQLDDMWKLVRLATMFSLEKSYNTGLISKEQRDEVAGMFEYYVPLRGWKNDYTGDVYSYISSGNPEAVQSTIKHAKGRKSEAANIVGTIFTMANSAIVMGNKNDVNQRLLNLAYNDPTGLLNVEEMWYEETASGELVPLFPDMSNENLTVKQKVKMIEEYRDKLKKLKEEGKAKLVKNPFKKGYPLRAKNWQEQQHAVVVKRGGEEYVVWVNGNPKIAQALNGLLHKSQREEEDNMASNILRWMAATQTSYSPEFVFTNFQRDMLTAMAGNFIKYGAGFEKEFLKALKEVRPIKNLWKSDEGTGIYNLFRLDKEGKLDMNNPIHKMFKEFLDNGGVTGISTMLDPVNYEKKVLREIEKANVDLKGVPQTVVENVANAVEYANRGIENATRFATYVASRRIGKSVTESVRNAKDVSVNFNMKGSGAWGNAFLRKYFIYANAAIQGLRTVYSWNEASKSRFYGLGASILATSVLMAFLNDNLNEWMKALFGGDDDDEDNVYYGLSEWNRYNFFNINIPFTDTFVHWSLPQEFRPIYAIGQISYDLMTGRITNERALKSMAVQLNNISPLSLVEDNRFVKPDDTFLDAVIKGVVPSQIRPMFEAYIWNEDFLGRKIHYQADYNRDLPEWKRAGKNTPEFMIDASRFLSEISGGEENKRGVLDNKYLTNPSINWYLLKTIGGGTATFLGKIINTTEHIINSASKEDYKEELDWNEIPVLPKILASAGDDNSKQRLISDKYNRYRHEFETIEKELSRNKNDKDMSEERKRERLAEIKSEDEYKYYEVLMRYEGEYDRIKKMIKKYEEEGNDEKAREFKDKLYEHKKKVVEKMSSND